MTNEESNSELWKKYVENPDAIGEGEKEVWMELQKILGNLLEELKTSDKIRINFTHTELTHIKKLLKHRNRISENFTKIVATTDTWEKCNDFIRAIGEYNFNDINYIYMLVELSVISTITDSESFKTILLFHLKDLNSYKATDFAYNEKVCTYELEIIGTEGCAQLNFL